MRIPIRVSARTFLALAGFLFTGVGLGFVYGGAQEFARERAYRTSGELIEALVVDKSIERASREGNSSTSYKVAYRFAAADGRALEGVETVSVEDWESVAPGSRFRIAYLPEAGTSRAAGASGMANALVMTSLGGVFAIVGSVFLVITARRMRREWRLLRHGIAAQGTVRAIEPSNVTINRVRQWIVRYEYPDSHAKLHEGESALLSPGEADAVEIGQSCDIRYDPERPAESLWVRERPSAAGRWTGLKNFALGAAALLFAALVGENVPAFKALDELAPPQALWLTAITVAMTAAGFALFMGGILYRLFSPAFSGASPSEAFTLKEAKQAWRQRAWRTSARWRANFIVSAGALLFTVGLFGFFVVDAPAGIKFLFIAALVYGAARLVVAWNREGVP